MSKETKLKIKRKEQGLTQAQIARKANVSIRHYQDIETVKHRPNVDTAKLIAKALNSTVEELF